MQADRTGYDDGLPYTATLVGGWETFQSGAGAGDLAPGPRRSSSRFGEPFQPQLAATVDYVVTIPPPPPTGADPGVLDVWDEGLWDDALWDAARGRHGTDPQHDVGVDRHERLCPRADRAGAGRANGAAQRRTDRHRHHAGDVAASTSRRATWQYPASDIRRHVRGAAQRDRAGIAGAGVSGSRVRAPSYDVRRQPSPAIRMRSTRPTRPIRPRSTGYGTPADISGPVVASPGDQTGPSPAGLAAIAANAQASSLNSDNIGGNLASPSPGLAAAMAAPAGTPAGYLWRVVDSPGNTVTAAPAAQAQTAQAVAQGLTLGGRNIAGHNMASAFNAFEGAHQVAPGVRASLADSALRATIAASRRLSTPCRRGGLTRGRAGGLRLSGSPRASRRPGPAGRTGTRPAHRPRLPSLSATVSALASGTRSAAASAARPATARRAASAATRAAPASAAPAPAFRADRAARARAARIPARAARASAAPVRAAAEETAANDPRLRQLCRNERGAAQRHRAGAAGAAGRACACTCRSVSEPVSGHRRPVRSGLVRQHAGRGRRGLSVTDRTLLLPATSSTESPPSTLEAPSPDQQMEGMPAPDPGDPDNIGTLEAPSPTQQAVDAIDRRSNS